MHCLGVSAFYHDSAAALVVNGNVVAAAEEERFTRRKHDRSFPRRAIEYCLREASIGLEALDRIVFYDSPGLKFRRSLETQLCAAPGGFEQFDEWLRACHGGEMRGRKSLARELRALAEGVPLDGVLRFSEHHLSHAASAFYPSPFEEAAILTVDGVGEWATTSVAVGRAERIDMLKELHFPNSLGLLYSTFTAYLGFKVNSGEYKVMGLAPYGNPTYRDRIFDRLVDLKDDGSFRLDQRYFGYCRGREMTNARFHEAFGGPPRRADEPLDRRHLDLAASIQVVCEEMMVRMARNVAAETGQRRLCLAGGVALNCVANARIEHERIFDEIWIQPAAGDSGGALGAALIGYHQSNPRPHAPRPDGMSGAGLGPGYTQDDIEARLRAAGARFSVLPERALIDTTVRALAAGKIVGWFQGRMEFGPRALGLRSILADPRPPSMQGRLNEKHKRRESFRPFAPAVLGEHASEWFEMHGESPYMLVVAAVHPDRRRPVSESGLRAEGLAKLEVVRSEIPAVTHVDYSARVQTVDERAEPRFRALLGAFHEHTGCPVLVNTSFNVRGEPIVCTPEDALECFLASGIDLLIIGDCCLPRHRQPRELRGARRSPLTPD